MVTILRALMATAEEFMGEIHTASLSRKEPDKSYTNDEIKIEGFMEDGRPYKLTVEFGDMP